MDDSPGQEYYERRNLYLSYHFIGWKRIFPLRTSAGGYASPKVMGAGGVRTRRSRLSASSFRQVQGADSKPPQECKDGTTQIFSGL